MDATGTEEHRSPSSFLQFSCLLLHFLCRNYKSEVMVPVKASGSSHCQAGKTGVCLLM